MLEQVTLEQAIATIGALAVLLQRVPRWKRWNNPGLKAAIVMVVGFLSPLLIAAISADPHIATNLSLSFADIFKGLWAAAGMFLLHKLDVLFDAGVKWVVQQLDPA